MIEYSTSRMGFMVWFDCINIELPGYMIGVFHKFNRAVIDIDNVYMKTINNALYSDRTFTNLLERGKIKLIVAYRRMQDTYIVIVDDGVMTMIYVNRNLHVDMECFMKFGIPVGVTIGPQFYMDDNITHSQRIHIGYSGYSI